MTLRTRLALLTSAAVVCAVVLSAAVSYKLVRDQLYQQVDDSLRSRVSELTSFDVGFGPNVAGGQKQIKIVTPGNSGSQSGNVTCRTQAQAITTTPPAQASQCGFVTNSDGPQISGGEVTAGSAAGGGPVIAVGIPNTSLGAAGSYTQIITTTGKTVLAPGETNTLPITATDIAVAKGKTPITLRTGTVDGTRIRIATAQMPGAVGPNGAAVAVMVARPLDETESVLANLRELLFLIGAAGALLAAVLGIVVARTTLKPVRRLIAATDHVADTRDLSKRIAVRGGSELDHLAMSFNSMLGALERSETSQRQLVADASHELRTPLTSLRTNVEVLAHGRLPVAERKRVITSVLGQIERLSGLVTGLIDLARGTEPVSEQADVALADVVELVVAAARTHWPELTFTATTDGSVVHGDPVRLERAISNLVDNAAKWSPPQGLVDIVVDHGEIRVADQGPGVAAADRPRIFDRFWRSPSARKMPGSGIGLAIVQQVAEAHAGGVTVEDAEGGGALFTLRLPIVDSSKILTKS
jgi:two-component system, OmpR family, sensor histidine kinase MprB